MQIENVNDTIRPDHIYYSFQLLVFSVLIGSNIKAIETIIALIALIAVSQLNPTPPLQLVWHGAMVNRQTCVKVTLVRLISPLIELRYYNSCVLSSTTIK